MSLVSITEELDVHSITYPVARKQYTCDECCAKIKVGDKYRRDFMVLYGDAETHFCCASCDDLMGKFFAAVPKEYRGEVTFETGQLSAAIIELREEYGATVEGFKYPSAEILQFDEKERD